MKKINSEKKFIKLKFPNGFILTGTDNDGYRHRYSVKKNEKFKNIFIKFMEDLGFDGEKIRKGFTYVNKDEITRELKISEITDVCRHYENKKFDVDVFFGNKKIILVIRTKNRRIHLDDLKAKSKWIKPLTIKKIKKINKPKIPMQKSFVTR